MSQQEILIDVITKLENLNIQYMLTGSTVTSILGEPRSTHDIDIIISINEKDIKILFDTLHSERFYCDFDSIKDSLSNHSMFNLIDTKSGDKVDFWILTDESFDKSRFSRKKQILIFNKYIYITSIEDTILMKLKWCKECNGSQKHYIDALRVYEINKDIIDFDYLNKWAKNLKISDLLDKIYKSQ